MRYFLSISLMLLSCFFRGWSQNQTRVPDSVPEPGIQGLSVSTFDIDATPPVGTRLAYDQMESSWDLGLRAKGIVLTGMGKPIVICAIDWLGIANGGQDIFKKSMAKAAGTAVDRVVVHTLHQHDAPLCDFSAEKLLKRRGMKPGSYEGSFARDFLKELSFAVKNSIQSAQPVTHIASGQAPVQEVASNRRIVGVDGKVVATRYSSCKDSALRARPIGVVDSMVSVIGFMNGNKPVAVLSFYAVHPQSYYLTKKANPDYPGLARFYRQLEVPDALHVHFNGAGGDITAGKYNDGSHELRAVLAQRLAGGMKRAWESSVSRSVSPDDSGWYTVPVLLEPSDSVKNIAARMKREGSRFVTNNAMKLSWLSRTRKGKAIDIACLKLAGARILFMPGELFVEYQLAAKSMRPDLFVAMAAYGDYGPSYIGTEKSYSEGGYEIGVSPVTKNSEAILMSAIKELLHH